MKLNPFHLKPDAIDHPGKIVPFIQMCPFSIFQHKRISIRVFQPAAFIETLNLRDCNFIYVKFLHSLTKSPLFEETNLLHLHNILPNELSTLLGHAIFRLMGIISSQMLCHTFRGCAIIRTLRFRMVNDLPMIDFYFH